MKQQGRYSFEAPWPQVAAALDELGRSDDSVERNRQRMLWGAGAVLLVLMAAALWQSGGLVMLVAVASTFLAVGVFAPIPAFARFMVLGVPGVMLMVALETPLQRVLLLVLAAVLVAWILLARFDLDDSRLDAPRRFLEVAGRDLRSDRPMKVTVDLRDHRARAFRRPVDGRKGRCKAFRMRWLELEGRLEDGTALCLSVERDIRRKEKPKRKYTKVNERLQDRIDLALRPATSDAETLRSALPPLPGLQVRSLEVRGDRICVSLLTPVATSLTNRAGTYHNDHERLAGGETLLRALVWLYGGVRRAGGPVAANPDSAS